MKGISDAMELLINVSGAWLKSVIGPISVLNETLPRINDERQISEATRTWVPSILVSIIVSLPMLSSYGIKWDNLGYHLFYWLTTILNLVVGAFLFHWLLIWFKLKSEFVRTFVILTTPFMAYSPIFSLAATPEMFRWLDALRAAKNAKQSFMMGVQHYITTARSAPDVFIALVDDISVVCALLCLALAAEAASQWYGNDRLKTYLVITLTTLVGLFFSIGAFMLQLWALYAFMDAS